MNVGQILETILGFAGQQLGKQIGELLENVGLKGTRSLLVSAYGKELIEGYEKEYGEEGLIELARRSAKEGVCFTTPVFDGANFDTDIKPLIEAMGGPVTGVYMIRDGRTGEYFDQPVTVGNIYMMKLNHMVDDKLHARSVGPYSLLRSSHWVVKRSLVDNDLVRWRYGLLKHMVQPTVFRKCSRINLMMW